MTIRNSQDNGCHYQPRATSLTPCVGYEKVWASKGACDQLSANAFITCFAGLNFHL